MINEQLLCIVCLICSTQNNNFSSVAVLLSSGSVQEMTQIQIKLQQAQSAKALSENMNKVLQVSSQIFFSAPEYNHSKHYKSKKGVLKPG